MFQTVQDTFVCLRWKLGAFDKDLYYNIKDLQLPSVRYDKAIENFKVGEWYDWN